MLAKPGSITPHKKFMGEVYILKKEEGGRHTPFFKGYRPQFYFRTTDVTGLVTLPEGAEMVMPGDNVSLEIELITPIACEEGLRFAIREGGKTVGAGVVTKILPDEAESQPSDSDTQDPNSSEGLRSPAARSVGRRDRRHRQADRRQRRRSRSAADQDQQVHRAALAARRQEVARAVRDPHPQAAARHPRADPADAGRAHEARPVGGRRRRDQDLSQGHQASMQIDIVNIEGKKVGQADLADAVFGAKVKDYLLWELVKAQQAAKRAGTHDTKTRDEVRGGGKKPYKQKGTGNARQGSTRAPNFVGGGKVFGPHPRDYAYTVPKKVKRAALASALSLRAQEKKLVVVDKLRVRGAQDEAAGRHPQDAGRRLGGGRRRQGATSTCRSRRRNLPKSKCLAARGAERLRHPQPPEPGDRRRRRQGDRGARARDAGDRRRRPP